jgi:hypothetical protein
MVFANSLEGCAVMPYSMDVSRLSLLEYRELLKTKNLLPGRRILWENIDGNFEQIGKEGIDNIAQLKKRLATPEKIAALAAATGVPEEYLTILKREAGSLEQKPVPIASFPSLEEDTVSDLHAKGIKTSKDYYESGLEESDELLCLCDLVRINGVGAVAARAFYDAGYRSVTEVANANAAEMLKKVSLVNEQKGYYKAKLGVKDMQFCIDFARLLMKYGE